MADGNPRVLFVGRSRYRLPLPAWLEKKWDAIEELIDYRVLGAAERSGAATERFRLHAPTRPRILDGVLFYLRLPFRIRRQIDDFRPDAIVAADPFVGAAVLLARRSSSRPPLIVEVHGDWRTFSRAYGSPARRLMAPFADALCAFVIRRADATRALSGFTSSLVEDVTGAPATVAFPTFSDLSAFTERPVAPLPERPTALFVGMLEDYKNVDGLADAWRQVARRVPQALLVIVGKGSKQHVIDDLVRDVPAQVEHIAELPPSGVAAQLDDATVLVLPSWPEGLGRVVIESFARGRGVVATGAGGILDLVTDDVEGLLIPRADTDALVAALVRVLTDEPLAARFSRAAHDRYRDWHSTPEGFARQTRALVDATLQRARD